MTILRQLSTHVVVLVSAPCMLPEVVLNPEKFSGYFRFWNSFICQLYLLPKPEVMGTMAKFKKHERQIGREQSNVWYK
jgi:hypothetical protein